MQPSRLLCAIGFGCLAVPSQAEEISDAVVLYEKICISSDGDLAKSEQLALKNGFSIRSDNFGVKTLNRDPSESLSAPRVVLKSEMPDAKRLVGVCEVFGSTTHMSTFYNYVQSQGLIEIPREEVFPDAGDQIYLRYFAAKDCLVSAEFDGKCRLVWTIGDPPVGENYSGAFRFSRNSHNHAVGQQ
ncbi:hypothetical protein LJR234_001288 [Mesorhizobium amorphae]|uniref:hypothetical protein n=1 Tax=Mesorhizobium amorphae TaxID=71433 RepID=UPI003ECDFB4D